MTLRYRESKGWWLFRILGRDKLFRNFFEERAGSATSRPMLVKLTSSLGKIKLARRKRAQVLPDRGYDARKMSSGNTVKRPSAMSRPRAYFTQYFNWLTMLAPLQLLLRART